MEKKPLMLMMKHTYKEWMNYMKRMGVEAGVPNSYHMIIMFLSRHPGVSQRELASYCECTPAAISQTIKDMQAGGYIKKEVDSRDQRFAKLYLTEKGQAGADKIREKIYESDKKITSVITKEKEEEMIRLMNIIVETIQKEL